MPSEMELCEPTPVDELVHRPAKDEVGPVRPAVNGECPGPQEHASSGSNSAMLDTAQYPNGDPNEASKAAIDTLQNLPIESLRRYHLRRPAEGPASPLIAPAGIRKPRRIKKVRSMMFAEEVHDSDHHLSKHVEGALEKMNIGQASQSDGGERASEGNISRPLRQATVNGEPDDRMIIEEVPQKQDGNEPKDEESDMAELQKYQELLAEVLNQDSHASTQQQPTQPRTRHTTSSKNQVRQSSKSSKHITPEVVMEDDDQTPAKYKAEAKTSESSVKEGEESEEEYTYDTYIYQPRLRKVDEDLMQGRIGLLIVDDEVRAEWEAYEEIDPAEEDGYEDDEEDENGL